jgi:DNA adenine methylase
MLDKSNVIPSHFNRSFLKWAGSKFRVLPHILPKLPQKQRLVEAFVGSGSLFFNTTFPESLLIDINHDLINVYQCLQKEGESFITLCNEFFIPKNNLESRYYTLRDKFNDCSDPMLRAALFIYLNRHGYNGLCRYNGSGLYNVPFGRHQTINLPEKAMRLFYEKSKSATFLCANFLKLPLNTFQKSDIIYCDPPYAPIVQGSNFTRYSFQDFDIAHQESLVKRILQLNQRGITVIVSNHDTPLIRELYTRADIISFDVQRYINRNVKDRGAVKEILAVFPPLV